MSRYTGNHMKTVLITGIGRGIGRAEAHKFLKEGFRVFGTSTTGAVDYSHENLKIFQLDLRSPESIAACISALEAADVSLDVLLNNAGVLLDEDDTVLNSEKLRATLDVNLIGTVAFTEKALSLVKKGGIVVFTASTAGSLALTGHETHWLNHYPAYKISKAALNMYMRTLASRLKPEGITVISVHPGWVKTEMGGEDADITPEAAAEGIYNAISSCPETGTFRFGTETLPW